MTSHLIPGRFQNYAKPLFFVNVADINHIKMYPRYISCTTEPIFESKDTLYDLFVHGEKIVYSKHTTFLDTSVNTSSSTSPKKKSVIHLNEFDKARFVELKDAITAAGGCAPCSVPDSVPDIPHSLGSHFIRKREMKGSKDETAGGYESSIRLPTLPRLVHSPIDGQSEGQSKRSKSIFAKFDITSKASIRERSRSVGMLDRRPHTKSIDLDPSLRESMNLAHENVQHNGKMKNKMSIHVETNQSEIPLPSSTLEVQGYDRRRAASIQLSTHDGSADGGSTTFADKNCMANGVPVQVKRAIKVMEYFQKLNTNLFQTLSDLEASPDPTLRSCKMKHYLHLSPTQDEVFIRELVKLYGFNIRVDLGNRPSLYDRMFQNGGGCPCCPSKK